MEEVWQIVDVQKILAHSSGLSVLFLPYHRITRVGEGGLGLVPEANPSHLPSSQDVRPDGFESRSK